MNNSQYNLEVEKINSLLFGFAMKLTKNKEDARDLMQDTLMKSYDKRDRFHVGTNFKAWMTTIMYNSFVNGYRRKKTRNQVLKPIEDLSYLVENKSTDGKAYSMIQLKELNNIVDKLSKDYKVPFKMYVDGYHYDEIAEKLDIPMGTLKSRIFYARKKLKEMVYNQYGEDIRMAA